MKPRLTLVIFVVLSFMPSLVWSQKTVSLVIPNPIQPGSTFTATVTLTIPDNNEAYSASISCSGCTVNSINCNLPVQSGCGSNCPPASCSVMFTAPSNPDGMQFDATVTGDGNSGCTPCTLTPAVLPVNLSTFYLTPIDNSISLNWQTSSELNNDKFIIETSTEGEVFNRIGEMDGAGTTTEPQDYTFTHHTPSAGVNYYRLKQVDFDGTFEYSKVIAINTPGSKDIFAFPNPAKDKITLQYDHSKGAGNIQLFDALGRRVNASIAGYAGNYEVKLPEGLPKGTYWLKVERGGQVQTVPVVKE